MSLRVVLYAEGTRERARELTLPPTPGAALPSDNLGPGHILVARCLERVRGVPRAVIQFEGPLRDRRARVARGSMLYDPPILRQLLTWARAQRRPDIAIVLVDADGDGKRYSALIEAVTDLPVDKAIAVASPEFEAWLAADHEAVRSATRMATTQPLQNIDALAPREAKQYLGGLATTSGVPETQLRISLAEQCDLDRLARASASFARFLKDLERA